MFHINKEENKMNYLDDKDYEDVSFIKKHPEIKGVFITIAVLVISFFEHWNI